MTEKLIDLRYLLQNDDWQYTGSLAGILAPQLVNPPGLPEIGFRLGTQSQFAAELLRRTGSASVGGQLPLAKINSDPSNDWIIALLDGWAMVGDILSFYQERNANEAYIGTATQADSIRYLLATLGPPVAPPASGATPAGDPATPPAAGMIYPLEPGAAATADIALTVTANPATPSGIAIAAGSTVNIHNLADGTLLPYEITDAATMIPSLSAVPLYTPPADWPGTLPAHATGILLGDKAVLAKGSALLLLPFQAAAQDFKDWFFATVTGCEPYEGGSKTLVRWSGPGNDAALRLDTALETSQPMLPFGADARPLAQASIQDQLQNLATGGVEIWTAPPPDAPEAPAFVRTNLGFPNAAVRDIAVGTDGGIYLATAAGVYARPAGASGFSALSQGLPTRDIYGLAIDAQGLVYAAGAGGAVARITDPGSAWQVIDGNRSMVPTPGGPTPPLYTALPQSVVLKLRVLPDGVRGATGTAAGTSAVFALTGTGIAGNWFDRNGWQLKNPPTQNGTVSDSPTGSVIRDFLVIAEDSVIETVPAPLRYLVIAAIDDALQVYSFDVTINGASSAGTTGIATRPTPFQHLRSDVEHRAARAAGPAGLPPNGSIPVQAGTVLALALCHLPSGLDLPGPMLVAAAADGIMAFNPTTGAFQRLGAAQPGGTVLTVAAGPMTGFGGGGGRLIVLATYADGLHGFLATGVSPAGQLPSGEWIELLPFAATADQGTGLPAVAPRAAARAGQGIYALAPLSAAAQWAGYALPDGTIDLTTTAPLTAAGRYLVIADIDPDTKLRPTLRRVRSSNLSTAVGFGMPPRPIQRIIYDKVPAASPAPSAFPLRRARAYVSGKGHATASPAPLTAAAQFGDELVVAGSFDTLAVPRRITLSGTAPRCALEPAAGLLVLDGTTATTTAQGLMTGASVTALAAMTDTVLVGMTAAPPAWPDGGIYRSVDGGVSWQADGAGLGQATGQIAALALGSDGTALAVAAGGLFVQPEAGTPWEPVDLTGLSCPMTMLVALPRAGFAAGSDGGGLWLGDSGGTVWHPVVTPGLPAKAVVTALAAGPAGTALAALSSGEVLQVDTAGTVTSFGIPVDGLAITALGFDEAATLVLAGSSDGRLLCRAVTTDGTWRDTGLQIGSGAPIASLATGLATTGGTGFWLAGGPGWLATTSDQGAGWSRLPTPQANDVATLAIASGPDGAPRVFAGCGSAWVSESTDGRHRLARIRPTALGTLDAASAGWLDQSLLPSSIVASLAAQSLTLPAPAGVQAVVPGRLWLVTGVPTPVTPAATAGRMAASGLSAPAPQSSGLGVEASSCYLLVAEPSGLSAGITVFAQPQPLVMAAAPSTVSGSLTRYALAVPGQPARALVMDPAAVAFLPSLPTDPTIAEGATITAVTADWAAGTSRFKLKRPLANGYLRDGVLINMNVLKSAEGRRVSNLPIGSGNAALANQRFTIPMPPLLFDKGDQPGERKSTLRITVAGQVWQQVSSLADQGPHDKVYVLEITNGAATVTFGDGKAGDRLPTGNSNVLASFRSGSATSSRLPSPGNAVQSSLALAATLGGAPAAPNPGTGNGGGLAVLTNVPNGVQPVANPIPSSPSTPATPPSAMQQRVLNGQGIPQRLIAERDYVGFARAYPGVGHALAALSRPTGRPPLLAIALTADTGDDAMPPETLMTGLAEAIRQRQTVPRMKIVLVGTTPRFFTLAAQVWTAAGSDPAKVSKDLNDALDQRFGTVGSTPGRSVRASEIIATMQSITGVEGLVLTALQLRGERPALRNEIVAAPIGFDAGGTGVRPPDWLLLAEATLTVTARGDR